MSQSYRNDIQGIRAIGAILICVYHIWLNKVSGGVDVFFVVSGFLMTSMLWKELSTERTIRPLNFWWKIFCRIAPTAYFVLCITAIFVFVFSSPIFWRDYFTGLFYSALHVQNFELINTATSYLSADIPPSPFQQFWALSVQMQFYLLLPAIFFIPAYFITNKEMQLRVLIVIMFCFMTASLSYSAIATAHNPTSAYFHTAARGWEFLVGALLSLLRPFIRVRFEQLAAILGLAGLFLTGIVVPSTVHFPGLVALLPVLSAALLIYSGFSQQAGFVNRMLSNKLLTYIGNISFGIYLWHWPILTFYKSASGNTVVPLVEGVAIILTAIVLAKISARYIEKSKGREFTYSTMAKSFVMPVFSLMLAIVVVRGLDHQIGQFIAHIHNGSKIDILDSAPEFSVNMNDVELSSLLASRHILPKSYNNGCHQDSVKIEVIVCEFGDKKGIKTVALVGGSHATQWLPALHLISLQRNIKLVTMTKSGCMFGALPGEEAACHQWNIKVVEALEQLRPDLVISNYSRIGPEPERIEFIPDPYVEKWQRIAEFGIPVLGIRDNPAFGHDVPLCVAENKSNPKLCLVPVEKVYGSLNAAEKVKEKIHSFRYIDVMDLFCDSQYCYTNYNGVLMYRDSHHISVQYVLMLQQQLAERLENAAPDIF